jgi:hypothetical protein
MSYYTSRSTSQQEGKIKKTGNLGTNKLKNLNPYWITGFCDRSSSFTIIPALRKKANDSTETWEIRPTFEILVALKYKEVLDSIQNYFGIGKIYVIGNKVYYRVTKFNYLIDIIIPHFDSYPLLSVKTIIFSIWVKAVELLATGQHQNKNGLLEILSIYAAIGRGPSKNN